MTIDKTPLSRLLIVLDLDETLIHATGNPTLDPPDFEWEGYRVRRRPGLGDFLARIARFAEVAVWSSASDDYVEALLPNVVPADVKLRFAWGASRCTRRYDSERFEQYWVKDLNKVKRLGFPLERVLMVDDTPEKIERHYGNYVRVEPFYGDLSDRWLEPLAAYLETFAATENVRVVEKRGWQNRPDNFAVSGHRAFRSRQLVNLQQRHA